MSQRALFRGARIFAVIAATGAGAESDSAPLGSAQESRPEGEYVEEVLVIAERLEKGKKPTGTIIVQTYNVRRRGMWLYEERRYREALPLLLLVAKRGFKWPQAMAGDVYLHGRGGVPRDLEAGIGWLGVAAAPRTEPQIDSYFRQVMAELPEPLRGDAVATVDRYRRQWDSNGWRVSCRRVVSDSLTPIMTSLRLNRRLRCTYMDEVPICRPSYLDPIFGPPIGEQMQWECGPLDQQARLRPLTGGDHLDRLALGEALAEEKTGQ